MYYACVVCCGQSAADQLAITEPSLQYAAEVGVNAYVRLQLSFLSKQVASLWQQAASPWQRGAYSVVQAVVKR